MVKFQWVQFAELTVEQLYNVLMMRSDVFVVQQNCVYQDLDGKDIFAKHLLGLENHSLVAYLRLFPPTDTEKFVKFGRVLTARAARNKGYGKKLIAELLAYCHKNYPGLSIKCSA